MASGAVTPEKSATSAGALASEAERRASVRYPCDLDILYWKSTGSAAEACRSAKILDISAGGICLLLSRPFEAGTVLTLQLESANQKCTRTLMVHVVHARPQSHSEWVIGCAFDSRVSAEEARALADWSPPAAGRRRRAEQTKGPPAVPRTTLTPKQKRAIEALLTLPTLAAVAAAVNVNENTVRTWLKLPLFQTAYRAARRQAVRRAAGRLQQLAGKAVDVLERHLTCGDAAAEIQAALGILAHAVQTNQRTNSEPRSAGQKQHLESTSNGRQAAVDDSVSSAAVPS